MDKKTVQNKPKSKYKGFKGSGYNHSLKKNPKAAKLLGHSVSYAARTMLRNYGINYWE